MLRRTPCIGTCSTTYGDLVCRGCKRFAHEIVQWNAYDAEQRRAVWQRLLELRAGAVRSVLEIRDLRCLREQADRLGVAGSDDVEPENLLYDLLQRLQWREPEVPLWTSGTRSAASSRSAGPASRPPRCRSPSWRSSTASFICVRWRSTSAASGSRRSDQRRQRTPFPALRNARGVAGTGPGPPRDAAHRSRQL